MIRPLSLSADPSLKVLMTGDEGRRLCDWPQLFSPGRFFDPAGPHRRRPPCR
jgi:hypothetical protein